MNVGIVTQPLVANYGGFLQNYAMQKALEKIGCNPITLDIETHLNTSYSGYLRYIASLFVKRTFKGGTQSYPHYWQKRPKVFDDFVKKNIKATSKVKKYSGNLVKDYQLDCLLVGSDQVWRPKFNVFPEDMYLAFASDKQVRRVAYAASFGVDNWEYGAKLTETCRILAQKFDAISVREVSGIGLCKEHLQVDATKVLDPTLLNDATLYNELCKIIPKTEEKYVAIYALGLSGKAKQEIEKFAQANGMSTKFFTLDADFNLTVPEWISMIRDASFVITDSFHGTAFSIIYNKDFYSIINKSRGTSRFESILKDFGLNGRLLDSTQPVFPKEKETIDWQKVNEKREEMKKTSMAFLCKALQV